MSILTILTKLSLEVSAVSDVDYDGNEIEVHLPLKARLSMLTDLSQYTRSTGNIEQLNLNQEIIFHAPTGKVVIKPTTEERRLRSLILKTREDLKRFQENLKDLTGENNGN